MSVCVCVYENVNESVYSLCLSVCLSVYRLHMCMHVCGRWLHAFMPVCLSAGRAHAAFYRGAFPSSIHGMLVSSAPDNTPCSIIMRHHTPLGTQADKVFLPSLLIHSFPLFPSVFLLKISFSSLLLVVLER